MLLKSTLLRVAGALLVLLTMPIAHAQASDGPPIVYRVVEGDTLYNIARRFLRSQSNAREVQRLNRIRNPRRIPINKRIRIPRRLLRYQPIALSVEHFSGPVTVNNRTATANARLNEAQEVATGPNGFVSFSTPSGVRYTMPSNSRMRLSRARRYVMNDILDVRFEIVRGRGSVRSPKLKEQDRLRTRTPVATTAVRGTVFRVGYLEQEERSLTEVVEGSVGVEVGADTSITKAGFGLASTQAGIGEEEPLLPAIEMVEATKPQTSEKLTFTLTPIAEADKYRVQIAKDASFLSVVSETIVSGSAVELASVEDRRYYVRVRGISANGLEGKSRPVAHSFLRKRLGVSGSSARSELLNGFVFNWIAVGEGKSTFAFQLWDKDNPDELVIDETGLDKNSLLLTNLNNGTYDWRVAVMQTDAIEGLIKVWGEPQTLVVAD